MDFQYSSCQTEVFASGGIVSVSSWSSAFSGVGILCPVTSNLWVLTARGRAIFSRWMALNNPPLIFVVLKGRTMVMQDFPFRLAFTNGLMSESMFLWFTVFLFALWRKTGKIAPLK